jgi:putative ABC transport system ATP-binding protein
LAAVGLSDRTGHYPVQLSGGEQQRVAVARAFACRPPILLADEPTGNLDSTTGTQVIDLLLSLHRDYGTTLVLVTHDPVLASLMQRVVSMRDGHLESDSLPSLPDFPDRILADEPRQ